MLTSNEIFRSEQLTEDYGERRQTHFREETAGLDGPAPARQRSAITRELLRKKLENSSKNPDATSMRIDLTLNHDTGEMMLVQTISDNSLVEKDVTGTPRW